LKIFITGIAGMLGQALSANLRSGHLVAGLDKRQDSKDSTTEAAAFHYCDIIDKEKVKDAISGFKPDVVVHAAAYTDVDGCERNPNKAAEINVDGTKNVAEVVSQCGAAIIYISTDYVFDGKKTHSYTEDDLPSPINVYGTTKLKGEEIIQSTCSKFVIVRTSWVFGAGGENFPDKIAKLAKKEKLLKLVYDKVASPTYTKDLSSAIAEILVLFPKKFLPGIYNVTNSGFCSWFELGKEVLRLKQIEGVDLAPIKLEDFLRDAKVPKMSALDNTRFKETFGELRLWQEALKDYMVKEKD